MDPKLTSNSTWDVSSLAQLIWIANWWLIWIIWRLIFNTRLFEWYFTFKNKLIDIMTLDPHPEWSAFRVTRRCPPHSNNAAAHLHLLQPASLTQWLAAAAWAATKLKFVSSFRSGTPWSPYLEHPNHHIMFVRFKCEFIFWVFTDIKFICKFIYEFIDFVFICELIYDFTWVHKWKEFLTGHFLVPKLYFFFMNSYINSWFSINSNSWFSIMNSYEFNLNSYSWIYMNLSWIHINSWFPMPVNSYMIWLLCLGTSWYTSIHSFSCYHARFHGFWPLFMGEHIFEIMSEDSAVKNIMKNIV